jgi:outer membrane protein assembly factor BamB
MRPYVHADQPPAYELKHYLSLRELCQMLISELPPEALELYRNRVDPAAKRLYDEAIASGDEASLRRVVEQFFASSYGDKALLRLGDLALERGESGQARGYWQQLISADAWRQAFAARPDRRPPWLVYPSTEIAPAEVAVRLVLASILDGAPTASSQLLQFRQQYPDARGRLAGHDANYGQTLGALLEASPAWSEAPDVPGWATFAGANRRTRQVRSPLDVGAVRWRAALPKAPEVDLIFSTHRVAEDRLRPLSYFPLVVGDVLLVNTQFEVRAYNLRTGAAAWGKDPVIYRDDEYSPERHANRPALGAPRFTMTALGGKLFVRMGNPITGSQNEQPISSPQGYIACLDLAAEGKLLWRAAPPEERWAFEGSPLCDGQRVFVGMRRSDVRPQAHVACLDVRTGQYLWRRLVCSAETLAQGQMDEITHNLLTLHEGTLYYNTNLGAVAAVDARSGHIAWLTTYPRAKSGDLTRRATHFYRDLTPCVYDRGRLFVAPSDAPPVFALDASSGLLLWKVESSQHDTPTHLIGVAGGHLWGSGEKLWWIDVVTGKRRGYWPDGNKGPKSLGRGALAGDKVYWPTAHEIHVFDQRSGLQVKQPIELSTRGAKNDHLQGGNLLVAGGYLLVLTNDMIFALDQHSGMRLAGERDTPPGARPTIDSRTTQ